MKIEHASNGAQQHPATTQSVATTRAERLELTKIVRQRAKLAKDNVSVREAQIIADGEASLSRRFKEQDEAWADIMAEARGYMAEVKEKLDAKCTAKGIPVDFRPSAELYWFSRGENADPHRRTELRAALRAQAAASAKAAKLKIDQQSVALQEKVMVGGLMSAEAKDFL